MFWLYSLFLGLQTFSCEPDSKISLRIDLPESPVKIGSQLYLAIFRQDELKNSPNPEAITIQIQNSRKSIEGFWAKALLHCFNSSLDCKQMAPNKTYNQLTMKSFKADWNAKPQNPIIKIKFNDALPGQSSVFTILHEDRLVEVVDFCVEDVPRHIEIADPSVDLWFPFAKPFTLKCNFQNVTPNSKLSLIANKEFTTDHIITEELNHTIIKCCGDTNDFSSHDFVLSQLPPSMDRASLYCSISNNLGTALSKPKIVRFNISGNELIIDYVTREHAQTYTLTVDGDSITVELVLVHVPSFEHSVIPVHEGSDLNVSCPLDKSSGKLALMGLYSFSWSSSVSKHPYIYLKNITRQQNYHECDVDTMNQLEFLKTSTPKWFYFRDALRKDLTHSLYPTKKASLNLHILRELNYYSDRVFLVDIPSKPILSIPVQELKEDQTVKLTCEFVPSEIYLHNYGNVSWFFSNSREDLKIIPPRRTNLLKIDHVYPYMIQIKRLTLEDIGYYGCQFQNSHGRSELAIQRLQLHVAPRGILAKSQQIEIALDSKHNFIASGPECNVEGSPTPTIFWFKETDYNLHPMMRSNCKYCSVVANASSVDWKARSKLLFKLTNDTDSINTLWYHVMRPWSLLNAVRLIAFSRTIRGAYTCKAQNSFGEDHFKTTLTTHLSAFAVKTQPNSEIVLSGDEPLVCEFFSNPRVSKVYWQVLMDGNWIPIQESIFRDKAIAFEEPRPLPPKLWHPNMKVLFEYLHERIDLYNDIHPHPFYHMDKFVHPDDSVSLYSIHKLRLSNIEHGHLPLKFRCSMDNDTRASSIIRLVPHTHALQVEVGELYAAPVDVTWALLSWTLTPPPREQEAAVSVNFEINFDGSSNSMKSLSLNSVLTGYVVNVTSLLPNSTYKWCIAFSSSSNRTCERFTTLPSRLSHVFSSAFVSVDKPATRVLIEKGFHVDHFTKIECRINKTWQPLLFDDYTKVDPDFEVPMQSSVFEINTHFQDDLFRSTGRIYLPYQAETGYFHVPDTAIRFQVSTCVYNGNLASKNFTCTTPQDVLYKVSLVWATVAIVLGTILIIVMLVIIVLIIPYILPTRWTICFFTKKRAIGKTTTSLAAVYEASNKAPAKSICNYMPEPWPSLHSNNPNFCIHGLHLQFCRLCADLSHPSPSSSSLPRRDPSYSRERLSSFSRNLTPPPSPSQLVNTLNNGQHSNAPAQCYLRQSSCPVSCHQQQYVNRKQVPNFFYQNSLPNQQLPPEMPLLHARDYLSSEHESIDLDAFYGQDDCRMTSY
ncbi:hypothetical protein Ciccas_003922 [Cichlidogyrus casuarinus]|uniref:Ig-like domain-containing protein n=1 Tax=Cichlidogyrus casuarinus TaxID=1844966 RepID=A0ABD2QCZ4_9PLAT